MGKMPVTRRRGAATVVALLAAAAVFVGASAVPAAALAPSQPDEGDHKKLRAALEVAAKGYVDAKAKLEHSGKRQVAFASRLKALEAELVTLTAEVGVVADRSYRMGRLTPVSMLLNSASPDAFLDRAAGLDLMTQRGDKQLRRLHEARDEATRAKAAIEHEIAEQKRQLKVMAKRKRDAERALAAVGGFSSRGYIDPNSPLARPAPRNSDGSWPRESCTINDPTTSGCITPRTLHAMNEAKAAGFKRYVSCYRSGGGGEHPKGRACDFAAAPDGFENVHASGGDRDYGNRLAAFYVKNASRLGVMYVIWYRQIWMPSTGWRSYNGGSSPASAHTNHVHLSML